MLGPQSHLFSRLTQLSFLSTTSVEPKSCWTSLLLAQTRTHVKQAAHQHPRPFPRKLLPTSSSGAETLLSQAQKLGFDFEIIE